MAVEDDGPDDAKVKIELMTCQLKALDDGDERWRQWMASMVGFDGWRRWVASMVDVDGLRRWWTGVFDTEGTDVEVPLCPQW